MTIHGCVEIKSWYEERLSLLDIAVSFDQVGLAVGDIAEIRQQASEKIAAMQVSASNGVFFFFFVLLLFQCLSVPGALGNKYLGKSRNLENVIILSNSMEIRNDLSKL